MSIDLQGWYIKTSKGVYYDRARYRLEAIGANHDWGYSASWDIDDVTGAITNMVVYRDGTGPQWWSADETHTFMEQVNLVIDNWGRDWDDGGTRERFLQEAEALEAKAKELGKPIVSEWL